DLSYLANLCHECNACYYACQYAPPHEFALNLPQTFAKIRLSTYAKHGWPNFLTGVFRKQASLIAFTSIVFIIVMLLSAQTPVGGSFYSVISHRTMVLAFGAVSLYTFMAFVIAFVDFWRKTSKSRLTSEAFRKMLNDVFRLRNLAGGGDGCTYPDEVSS